jgi:predicted exporter
MSLLPTSNQQPLVHAATDKMAARFSKRLILLLTGDEEASVRHGIESLASTLSTLPEVASITWQVKEEELKDYRQTLFPYRYALLDDSLRASLTAGGYQQVKDDAVQQLFSPMPSGERTLISDPFNLFNTRVLKRSNAFTVQVSKGLLKVQSPDTSGASYMLMITLAGDAFLPVLQQRILSTIEDETEKLTTSGVDLTMSGMLLHAAAGAKQARQEISTIGVGSLLGIIAIMMLVFRQFKPLLLMMFPVAIGCITAAAVTQLVFTKVHLITFAFGAGLVGVSIDYALHFLCERRNTDAVHILEKILPGLLLGLFSSVLAYAAQALAPFPGLQQMATFSVVGLIAAWLTVVLWFPLLTQNEGVRPLPMARSLHILRNRFPRLEKSPLLIFGFIIALIFAVLSLRDSQHLDDIRLLQTSPATLIEQEKNVQKALGTTSSSQFMLITAATLEQCLQKEERLSTQLDQLKNDGLITDYQTLSKELPSLLRQTQNSALVQQLYDTQLDTFYDLLKLPNSKRDDALSALQEDLAKRLTPEEWKQQRSSASRLGFIVQSTVPAATIIRFSGLLSANAKSTLQAISENELDVFYVDQVENISILMGEYRSQVMNWVLLAYLGVLLMLIFRYKQQVWRIVLPPLLASVFTLAILVQLEQGINLFHLMALILVLGIGLDMGIFLSETHEAAHTWLAVSLSTLTSLLAFGLLALSKTPVLHHFGLTVLIGLALVWLIAPLMRKEYPGDIDI